MFKNVASQFVIVFAWDNANGIPKTGDALNITARISKDSVDSAASNDVNPTEISATTHKGLYAFLITQAETNCDLFGLTAVSSTADIDLLPVIIYTAQYLQPTVAGRTLDVNAAGEAGLDLDNTSGTLAAAQFAAGFITATKFASGALDAAALSTDAVNEIRDAIGAMSISQLASIPGASPTLIQALAWGYMASMNKRDTTASDDEVHKSDGTILGTAAVSDDAVVFTKGKYA